MGALKFAFFDKRRQTSAKDIVDDEIANSLLEFANASQFRRACLSMMAWSLTNDDRKALRQAFIAMDTQGEGTLRLYDIKMALSKHVKISDEELQLVFKSLDANQDERVNYTDFLAATLSRRIEVHDDLILDAFARFDKDNSGFITSDDLKSVLSIRLAGTDVDTMINEADYSRDGKISQEEFIRYVKSGGDTVIQQASELIIEDEMELQKTSSARYRLSKISNTNDAKVRVAPSLPPVAEEKPTKKSSMCYIQ